MVDMNSTNARPPYSVPPEPSPGRSLVLATLVHAGLLLFLWAGVSWENTTTVAVEAEVWDMTPQTAAPAPEPEPEPEPVQPPEPVPVPLPEPLPEPEPPPAPKVIEPVQPKAPDIALEREKKRKQERIAEQKAQQERDEEQARELAEEKARELAEKKAKELAEKKAREQAEKAEKLAKAKLEAAEKKRLDTQRKLEMARIMGAAGTSGSAEKSSAPRIDTGYLASITAKIKSTTSYLGNTNVPGNPRVLFKIEELPTGEIISVKLLKSSGVPAFDDAVEKGIIKSSPLPKKKDGTVERTLEIGFSMKDLD